MENKVKAICDNGTHSAKIQDILSATGLSKVELWQLLCKASFKWRIGENINGIKLLIVLHEEKSFSLHFCRCEARETEL